MSVLLYEFQAYFASLGMEPILKYLGRSGLLSFPSGVVWHLTNARPFSEAITLRRDSGEREGESGGHAHMTSALRKRVNCFLIKGREIARILY